MRDVDGGDRDGAPSGGGYLPMGGTSSGGRRDGGTDVPDDTLLSELNAAQLDALCTEVEESFSDALSTAELEQVSCVFRALLSLDYEESGGVLVVDRAQCQERVADCLTLTGGTLRALCETEGFRAAAMSCEASADAYLDCAMVAAKSHADAVGVLTCDNLARSTGAQDAFRASFMLDAFAHEECLEVAARCPELFGDATRGQPAADGCDDTCAEADDGWCDDGGFDSQTSRCPLGTDCLDCGSREI